MLSIRIVTAGAILAFAVNAAAAQDGDAPGKPISLLQLLTHSSEAKTSAAKTSAAKTWPHAKFEAKPAATQPIRAAKHFHHHAARFAAATEDPAAPVEPAPTAEQTPEPASWSAQAAIDAAPPSIWPAGNAPTFAGVPDPEPKVAAAVLGLGSDRNTATSNAVADTQPVVALARQADSENGRDVWFEEILATLGGALAAGSAAWFLFGAAPRWMHG
jgi:hypothetical protein